MLLYRLALSLALPVLVARFYWQSLSGAAPREAFAERLGGGRPAAAGAIWLHAASNGELASAQPLVDALLSARPDLRLLVTTNTLTAQSLARSWAEQRLSVRMAPLDARWMLARFLARHRPAALIVVENELWPNRFAAVAGAGLPLFMVGGRISARSAGRWRRLGLGAGLMQAVTALSAQDAASEAAFCAMGLPQDRLLARLNLKTAVAAASAKVALPWPRASTVLAASTHPGEDEIVLDAFLAARRTAPGLRLILAPRHARRGPEVARLIADRGLGFSTRSAGEPPGPEVYLADTMGEMASWYAAAGTCFIGGSLVEKGGHTPFEPAAQGCALVHGPSVFNHAEAFAALREAGAARPVTDAATLAQAFGLAASAQTALAAKAQAALAKLRQTDGPAALAQALLARLGR